MSSSRRISSAEAVVHHRGQGMLRPTLKCTGGVACPCCLVLNGGNAAQDKGQSEFDQEPARGGRNPRLGCLLELFRS